MNAVLSLFTRFTVSILSAVLVLLVFPQSVAAQSGDQAAGRFGESAIQANEFGVEDSSYLLIPGASLVPTDSTTGYTKPFLFLQRTGGGTSEFSYPLFLPRGAILENIRLYFTDTNATQDVTLRLCVFYTNTNSGTVQSLLCHDGAAVSSSGTPGNSSIVMTINEALDPFYDQFVGLDVDVFPLVVVHLTATDSSQRIGGVRVQYKRQVSPAPNTATFTDVPTNHPFFQFIEALAASGITAGCNASPPQYCPDATLTRGQMAVFLARALGLHWAP